MWLDQSVRHINRDFLGYTICLQYKADEKMVEVVWSLVQCLNLILHHIKLILGIGLPGLDDHRDVILESWYIKILDSKPMFGNPLVKPLKICRVSFTNGLR